MFANFDLLVAAAGAIWVLGIFCNIIKERKASTLRYRERLKLKVPKAE